MGIPGLLKQLKSITTKTHVSNFKGLKVGIDAHCWLHRAAYSCARDIAKELYSTKFVSFILDIISMLLANGIEDITVVFDGGYLPMKGETNSKRRVKRYSSLRLGMIAESVGDHKLAYTHYQSAIAITSKMVHQLSQRLKATGVRFLISPYESDAQLAYMSQTKLIDLVITEDSDSIVFGCKQVLLKMDSSGNGELIRRCDLADNRDLSFLNWTDDQFKLFCCLSGCDYMTKLKNVGLKTAYKIVAKYRSLAKVCEHLRHSFQYADFDEEAAAQLERALLTFKHQTVYNPTEQKMQPLSPLPPHTLKATGMVQRGSVEDVAFLGPILDDDTARRIVQGEVDPITLLGYPADSQSQQQQSDSSGETSARVAEIQQHVDRMSTELKMSVLRGEISFEEAVLSSTSTSATAGAAAEAETVQYVSGGVGHSEHQRVEEVAVAGAASTTVRGSDMQTSSVTAINGTRFETSTAAIDKERTTSRRTEAPEPSPLPPKTPSGADVNWGFDCVSFLTPAHATVEHITPKVLFSTGILQSYESASLWPRGGLGGRGDRDNRRVRKSTAVTIGVKSRSALTAADDGNSIKPFLARDNKENRDTNIQNPFEPLPETRKRVNWGSLDRTFDTPSALRTESTNTTHAKRRRRSGSDLDSAYGGYHSDSSLSRRSQFVSPMVSAKFQTLNRRRSGMSGLGVRVSKGDARAAYPQKTESGVDKLVSMDHRPNEQPMQSSHQVTDDQQFFADSLFNSPEPQCMPAPSDRVSPFQLDLFQEDGEIDAYLSAAANQAALGAQQPAAEPAGVFTATRNDTTHNITHDRQSFFDQSPLTVSSEPCHPQTASSAATGIHPQRGRGILPPSPLMFKAPQQIEAELHYRDVSLGVFSPSLTAAREALQRQQLPDYEHEQRQGKEQQSRGALWDGCGVSSTNDSNINIDMCFSAPADLGRVATGRTSLWDSRVSSTPILTTITSGASPATDAANSRTHAERCGTSGGGEEGFSAYYLPHRSRGVFPVSNSVM